MQVMLENVPMIAFLGGWEIVIIMALVLILFGVKWLPEIARGLGEGMREFRKALEDVDKEASDAGKSLSGIYGKPAAQALTPDNQTAELYDPAALRDKQTRDEARKKRQVSRLGRLCQRIWRWLLKLPGGQKV
jgi:sec-independent protein translocase protein TatA